MAQEVSSALSVQDKVSMVWRLGWITLSSLFQYVTVLLRDGSSIRSYAHERRNRVAHVLCSTLNSKQLKSLYKPMPAVCSEACKERKVEWRDEDIPDGLGAKLYWLGTAKTKNLILYFHGGGFYLPADSGHFIFLADCLKKLEDAGIAANVAIPQYTLMPEARYPTQPKQAIAALQHILSQGYKPSDIVLAGDSAGGNLALAVLSAINHPTDELPALKIDQPFQGTILISPWLSFSTDTKSCRENGARDMLSTSFISEWGLGYAGSEKRNEYSEPVRANADWWRNLPTRDVLNIAGGVEVLRDSIEALGRDLSAAGVKTNSFTCAHNVHEECLMDAKSGLPPGEMSEIIWDYLVDRFQ